MIESQTLREKISHLIFILSSDRLSVGVVQLREQKRRLGGDLVEVFWYLKGCCRQNGERFFIGERSDRTRVMVLN